MQLRPLFILVVVLAILDLGAHVLTRPPLPPRPDPRVGQPVAARTLIEAAAQIRITDAGGSSTLLVKGTDASWHVGDAGGPPADFAKVSGFVRELARSTVTRFVTGNPDRLGDLDFTKTRITLLDAAGRESWSLELGKDSDLGGRYVRFGQEGKAYLADTKVPLDADPRHWAAAGPGT